MQTKLTMLLMRILCESPICVAYESNQCIYLFFPSIKQPHFDTRHADLLAIVKETASNHYQKREAIYIELRDSD